ncbi:hypothetical protein Ciccas_011259 [Cichlidogyrus casuarinus]|uniref:Uncharacterized protein n=1 Tax=Cichlidogyrus casuarinus TaxID=1844966 RepID=A0ABD2PSK0_9PLAT
MVEDEELSSTCNTTEETDFFDLDSLVLRRSVRRTYMTRSSKNDYYASGSNRIVYRGSVAVDPSSKQIFAFTANRNLLSPDYVPAGSQSTTLPKRTMSTSNVHSSHTHSWGVSHGSRQS